MYIFKEIVWKVADWKMSLKENNAKLHSGQEVQTIFIYSI